MLEQQEDSKEEFQETMKAEKPAIEEQTKGKKVDEPKKEEAVVEEKEPEVKEEAQEKQTNGLGVSATNGTEAHEKKSNGVTEDKAGVEYEEKVNGSHPVKEEAKGAVNAAAPEEPEEASVPKGDNKKTTNVSDEE
ncbi:hypothetical protein KEM55_008660, partial [Ascosphaera atra]